MSDKDKNNDEMWGVPETKEEDLSLDHGSSVAVSADLDKTSCLPEPPNAKQQLEQPRWKPVGLAEWQKTHLGARGRMFDPRCGTMHKTGHPLVMRGKLWHLFGFRASTLLKLLDWSVTSQNFFFFLNLVYRS